MKFISLFTKNFQMIRWSHEKVAMTLISSSRAQAASASLRVDQPQIARAASTTRRSFARSSASLSGLPATLLAKPHCGLAGNAEMQSSFFQPIGRCRRPILMLIWFAQGVPVVSASSSTATKELEFSFIESRIAIVENMSGGRTVSNDEQSPFTFSEFTENPEPRCACLLLLDTSGSMGGAPIRELNAGLLAFKDELSQDSLAMKRVEIAVVTFGPVNVISDFQTVDNWQPSHLSASGDTPMGAAIVKGLEMLRQRKDQYRAHAIEVFRPWVFLMTDGGPTDAWTQAAEMVKAGEASKGFAFFGVGVENANMEILAKICVRTPVKMAGLKFKDMFAWLSSSLSNVSSSQPGTTVQIPAPAGWTEV